MERRSWLQAQSMVLFPLPPFHLSCEFNTATELVNTSSQTLSDTSKQDQNFRLISNTYISNSSDQLLTDHRSDTRWVGGWFVLKPSVRDNWIMASTLRSCSVCLHCCVTQLQFCPFELLLGWYERYDNSYLSKIFIWTRNDTPPKWWRRRSWS